MGTVTNGQRRHIDHNGQIIGVDTLHWGIKQPRSFLPCYRFLVSALGIGVATLALADTDASPDSMCALASRPIQSIASFNSLILTPLQLFTERGSTHRCNRPLTSQYKGKLTPPLVIGRYRAPVAGVVVMIVCGMQNADCRCCSQLCCTI